MTAHLKKQQGLGLLEIMAALLISSYLIIVGANLANEQVDNIKDQQAAQYQSTISAAYSRYLHDNFTTIAAGSTATSPYAVTFATLQAANYLPTGTAGVNSYNQAPCMLVLQPSSNVLQAVVVTEGGTAMPIKRTPFIAAQSGNGAGYITNSSATTAQGAYGSFTMDLTNHLSKNCSGTVAGKNHLATALFMDNGNLVQSYLYRGSVAGHPEANTMTTPLIMSSSQTVGNACTTNGAIAQDGTGAVVSCVSSKWQRAGSAYWQDPVANAAALPTCNAAAQWQTRVVESPTVGSGSRAYTCNGAGVWQALGIDDNGNLTVAGTATIGTLSVTGNSTIGDASTDTVTVNGTSTFNSGLTIGNGTAATASNTLVVNRTATESAACSPNGAVARDSNGLLLSCQSGVWGKASGINIGIDPVTGYPLDACVATGQINASFKRVGGAVYSIINQPNYSYSSGWSVGSVYATAPYNTVYTAQYSTNVYGLFNGTKWQCLAYVS